MGLRKLASRTPVLVVTYERSCELFRRTSFETMMYCLYQVADAAAAAAAGEPTFAVWDVAVHGCTVWTAFAATI